MATLKELYFGPSESVQLGGDYTAIRRFSLTDAAGVTMDQARNFPGVPIIGQAHPTIPGLVATNVNRIPVGRNVEITVLYGIPERNTARPPVDPLSPNFQSMDTSYREDDVELPVYAVLKVTMKDGENSTVEKNFWQQVTTRRIIKTVPEFTYRLSGTFTAQFTPAQWLSLSNTIRAEANKLHKFNGLWYLFKPRRISQESSSTETDPARWAIEYTWAYDPGLDLPTDNSGTPLLSAAALNPTGGGGVNNLRTFYTGTQPSGGYIPVQTPAVKLLEPWHTVDVNDDPRGPEYAPLPSFYLRFRPNPDGWQSLPGLA